MTHDLRNRILTDVVDLDQPADLDAVADLLADLDAARRHAGRSRLCGEASVRSAAQLQIRVLTEIADPRHVDRRGLDAIADLVADLDAARRHPSAPMVATATTRSAAELVAELTADGTPTGVPAV